jgi:hypothetical protein
MAEPMNLSQFRQAVLIKIVFVLDSDGRGSGAGDGPTSKAWRIY